MEANVIVAQKKVGISLINFLIDKLKHTKIILIIDRNEKRFFNSVIKKININTYYINDEFEEEINFDGGYYFNWLLNIWGGHIFSEKFISNFKNTLNIHPSFLPFFRGRDPIVWAIVNDFYAGVTFHKISNNIDEGEIIFQKKINYNFPERGIDLYERVLNETIDFFMLKWDSIYNQNFKLKTQNPKKPQKIFKRKDLINHRTIDLDIQENNTIKKFLLKVLAYDFANKYSIIIKYKNKKYSLKLNIHNYE